MADEQLPGQLPLFDLPGQPEMVSPGQLALTVERDRLRAANRDTYQALLQTGRMPDPAHVLSIRMEALVDQLDPTARLAFDVAFETAMAGFLKRCREQAAREELLAPPKGPNGLVLPS